MTRIVICHESVIASASAAIQESCSTLLKGLSLTFLFLFFQSAIASTESDALEDLMGAYTTYQAAFTQVNYDTKGRALKKSQGTVYMVRPGRFRWETMQPYQQIVIANDKTLWVYDVDLSQATRQSLSTHGFNPAMLLTQPVQDLTKTFTITQDDTQWFKLVPKESNENFKAVYLQFRKKELTGLKVDTQLDQTNLFTFSKIQVNKTLNPKLFKFTPPTGVQVLDNE